ncbi:hypothetical protein ABZY19_06365 [Streptomyces sp. NPDC006475]|uniref:hypothetical protein n=1 Tax=Streptomyces sp. NPDC006475 TaxID=3155719 RepID=UPI0033AF13F2
MAAGSALAGDDAKTDPYQVSHNAWSALCVAADHLHCFCSTLVGDMGSNEIAITLHTHGQYSLLRGAFENRARVVWILGPRQRLVRVQRRLSLQAGEAVDKRREHAWTLIVVGGGSSEAPPSRLLRAPGRLYNALK